ncbi:MAG: hypothetical protein JST00_13695 [Deltaproteobacteria bacterium]|nr:hypothetical protein [Deltaproteobacteria bacterium]
MNTHGSNRWGFVVALALASASLVGCGAAAPASTPKLSGSAADTARHAPAVGLGRAATPAEKAVLRELLGEPESGVGEGVDARAPQAVNDSRRARPH